MDDKTYTDQLLTVMSGMLADSKFRDLPARDLAVLAAAYVAEARKFARERAAKMMHQADLARPS